MHALHGADASTEERVFGVIPEILGNKVIDKGVDAAVEGRQAEGDQVEGIDVALAPAFNEEIMNNQQKVAGSKADEVHGQDGDNESDRPSPFLLRVLIHGGGTERFDHEYVGRCGK